MATAAFLVFKTFGQPVITGESQDQTYGPLGAIEPQEWGFGVSNPSTIGAGGGKAKLNQFTFKKRVDKASSALFQYATQGLHLPEATLYIRKAAGVTPSPPTYLTYSFGLVYITDVEWSEASGDEALAEQVTFVYGSFQINYTPQNPDGTLNTSAKQTASWSQIQNLPIFQTK